MKSERLVNSANHTSYIYIADKAVSLISIRLLTDVSGQKPNEKEKKSRNKEKKRREDRRKNGRNGGIMKKYIYSKTGENM